MRFAFYCFGALFLIFTSVSYPQTGGEGLPLSAMQNYRMGRELEARNRLSEAENHYNEAVRICQAEVARNAATRDTYTAITWTLERQRKYAAVITWGERGLRVFSDEYRIVEMMGEAYFYLEDYDMSLSFMQRYANSQPGGERISVAYFFIGEIYRFKKKYRHADIAYTTAVVLEPNLALWWYRLGTVRESAGDRAPAIEAYERALSIDPGFQDAGAALARARTQ
jgi:tetratricopeptide (TPR) repeat protein